MPAGRSRKVTPPAPPGFSSTLDELNQAISRIYSAPIAKNFATTNPFLTAIKQHSGVVHINDRGKSRRKILEHLTLLIGQLNEYALDHGHKDPAEGKKVLEAVERVKQLKYWLFEKEEEGGE